MKKIDYIIETVFGKYWTIEDEKGSLSMAKKASRAKNIEKFTEWPIILKTHGYRGNYSDNKEEILKLVPPSLLERACGFSLYVDVPMDYDVPLSYEAMVSLYREKAPKVKQRKQKKNREPVFKEFGF